MAKGKENMLFSMGALALASVSSILLARALGISGYGLYIALNSLSSICIKFVGLGANTFLSSRVSKKGISRASFHVGLILNIGGALIASVISFIVLLGHSGLDGYGAHRIMIALALSCGNYFAIGDYYLALTSGAGHHLLTSRVNFYESVLKFLLTTVIFTLKVDVIASLFLLAAPAGCRCFMGFYIMRRQSSDIFKGCLAVGKNGVKRVFRLVSMYSLPLCIGTGFLGLYMRSPIFVSTGRISNDSIALLSVVLASSGIYGGLANSYLTNTQRASFQMNENKFKSFQYRQFRILFVGGFITALLAPGSTLLMFNSLLSVDLLFTFFGCFLVSVSQLISLLHGQSLRRHSLENIASVRFVLSAIFSVVLIHACVERIDDPSIVTAAITASFALSLGASTLLSKLIEKALLQEGKATLASWRQR